jgi:sn1-specific diacylglycerol lipase
MTNPFCCSNRYNISGRGGKAERFEWQLGLLIKFVSLLTRGRLGGKYLKNKDELTDFATSIITMLNNETKLGLVFSDLYVGMKIHSRVQAEKKHHVIRDLLSSHKQLDPTDDESSLVPLSSSIVLTRPTTVGGGRQSSIFILQRKDGTYKTSERTILDSNNIATWTLISDSAHYVTYASFVYVKLQSCVVKEFLVKYDTKDDMVSCFRRKLDTLFDDNYRLTSIGLEHARLCYSNFTNDIIATPYSIVIDDKMKTIVITVRGTRSLEDLVVDLQFTPESLEKVGRICGFDGAGHWCHKGFLTRSKWIYNDITRTRILNTLYLETSPYNTYPLVLCGHSLGAGCASILSLMLRPAFPSLQCFAYEPPGCIFNAELSELCTEFITSFVRHDDCIPRISYHNLELLRDDFFTTFERIKVPKIELYRHLRVPYSEVHVASRNAKVLQQLDRIPLESTFSKRIEQFRAERAIKNMATVPLFIPGENDLNVEDIFQYLYIYLS